MGENANLYRAQRDACCRAAILPRKVPAATANAAADIQCLSVVDNVTQEASQALSCLSTAFPDADDLA